METLTFSVDGLISLLLMCMFCDMHGLRYKYYVNENRYHGLNLPINMLRGRMVIAADFAIVRSEVEALVSNNVVLLSTDHHEVEDEFIHETGVDTEGLVINNQYAFEPDENRYLSGAGVFFETICEIYPEFDTPDRRGLVGITLLSDICEIENPKARKYLKSTYSMDTTKGYAQYLIKSTLSGDFGFGAPKLDRNFVDYTLSPCVNALLRANKTTEVTDFILGLGLKRTEATNAREKQKALISDMYTRGRVLELGSCAFLLVSASDFTDYDIDITSYIGLFCSDYKDKHKNISTLGMVQDNGKIVRASFRGKYDDVAYRTSFTGVGIKSGGHPNAFGIKDFQPGENTWQEINDLVADLESNHKASYTILEVANLAVILNMRGTDIAANNCYVRDMYRTYIRYTGRNSRVLRQSYHMRQMKDAEILHGVVPDVVQGNKQYVYERDADGKPLIKFMEYMIDGRKVKSFGVAVEDGVILPIMERGYMQLYVRELLE